MKENIQKLQLSAHKSAKEGDYDKALEILNLLQYRHKISTWDIVFYSIFYQYGRKGLEKSTFSHINELNKAVVATFATVLSQNIDELETLICFQDIYDQIWDLSTRLQQFSHKEYIGKVKGKSISEEFYLLQTQIYTTQLKEILVLTENFINALGNLSGYTTINLDLIWDFFQNNDGLFCFLLAYDQDPVYEERRAENAKIIQLKRPEYIPVTIPIPIKPAEIHNNLAEPPKKKGLLGRLFS